MKKKLPLYILTVISLYILQTSIFNYIKILGVKPNIIFLFVCIMSYLRGNKEGMYVGLFTGLFVDVMFGKVIGVYALTFMLAGFILGSIPRRLFWDNMLIVFIFVFIIVIPSEIFIYWLNKSVNYISGNTEVFVFDIRYLLTLLVFPEMLYNAIVFPFIYFLCIKLDAHFNKNVKRFVDE